jgi:hypothetical protein
MDEIMQKLKEDLRKAEAERDLWHARAFAMFWRLPDDMLVGDLQRDTERAKVFLRTANQ